MMATCPRCLSIISTRYPMHDCDRLRRERQEFDAQIRREAEEAKEEGKGPVG